MVDDTICEFQKGDKKDASFLDAFRAMQKHQSDHYPSTLVCGFHHNDGRKVKGRWVVNNTRFSKVVLLNLERLREKCVRYVPGMLFWEDMFLHKACERVEKQATLKCLLYKYRSSLLKHGGCSEVRMKRKRKVNLPDVLPSRDIQMKTMTDIEREILEEMIVQSQSQKNDVHPAKKSLTEVKGYYWKRREKAFHVSIWFAGEQVHIAYVDDEARAKKLAKKALRLRDGKLHGCTDTSQLRNELGFKEKEVKGYGWCARRNTYEVRFRSAGEIVHIASIDDEDRAKKLAKKALRLRDDKLDGCSDASQFRKELGLEEKEVQGYCWSKKLKSYQVRICSGGKRVHIAYVDDEARAKKLAKRALRLRDGDLQGIRTTQTFRKALRLNT